MCREKRRSVTPAWRSSTRYGDLESTTYLSFAACDSNKNTGDAVSKHKCPYSLVGTPACQAPPSCRALPAVLQFRALRHYASPQKSPGLNFFFFGDSSQLQHQSSFLTQLLSFISISARSISVANNPKMAPPQKVIMREICNEAEGQTVPKR